MGGRQTIVGCSSTQGVGTGNVPVTQKQVAASVARGVGLKAVTDGKHRLFYIYLSAAPPGGHSLISLVSANARRRNEVKGEKFCRHC